MVKHKGGSQDAVLSLMKTYNVPPTLENYLELAYFGNPPEITAEVLAEIPSEIKKSAAGSDR